MSTNMSIECSSCVHNGRGVNTGINCKDGQTPPLDGNCQSYKPNLPTRVTLTVKRGIEGLTKSVPLKTDYDFDDL